MTPDDFEDELPGTRVRPPVGWQPFTIGWETREYGGPEEGGWWYDTFTPIRTVLVRRGGKRQERHRDRLEAWVRRRNLEDGNRPIDSVLSVGQLALVHSFVVAREPAERPHYC